MPICRALGMIRRTLPFALLVDNALDVVEPERLKAALLRSDLKAGFEVKLIVQKDGFVLVVSE